MRITLRAAVLLGALASAGVTSLEAAPAAAKGKSEVRKSQPVAAATKGKSAARKGKVEPLAGKAAARTVADKRAPAPLARNGRAAPLAVPMVRKDKAMLRAERALERAHIRQVAISGRSLAAVEGHTSLYQKRNLNRLFTDGVDLWKEPGALAVHSESALVIPQDGGEPLYEKNANAVVPIASITKLMTAMVVLDSLPNLQAPITISEEDVDSLRGSRSRLAVGAVIPRETALLLALMSSENRAANALGRNYPGGLQAFVPAMNRKAVSLGMTHSHFEDPTGLDSNNVSTAHDLARMVAAAHRYPLIREFSTTPGTRAEVNGRELDYHNTNQLVSNPTWEIGLSKTGYIREAGKCLVMQARVAEKPVVIVLLDSAGKQTRIGDAIRIKRWMESAPAPAKLASRL